MSADYFTNAIDEWKTLLPELRKLTPQFQAIGHAFIHCWENGGKILFAGNGGSAADAMHFAEELVVRFNKNRRALAAIALLDPTTITCAGNDLGYHAIFSRQIEALGNKGDIFVGISTSGNSQNILAALELSRQKGLTTIGFLGKDGGQCRALCDIPLIIPSPTTARVQEAHKLLYHALCGWIDEWALNG